MTWSNDWSKFGDGNKVIDLMTGKRFNTFDLDCFWPKYFTKHKETPDGRWFILVMRPLEFFKKVLEKRNVVLGFWYCRNFAQIKTINPSLF